MPRVTSINTKDVDVDLLLLNMKERLKLSDKEIQDLAFRRDIKIPVTIFTSELGMLEAIVVYLKDDLRLSFKAIASIVKRDYKTVWTSYSKAKKKTK